MKGSITLDAGVLLASSFSAELNQRAKARLVSLDI